MKFFSKLTFWYFSKKALPHWCIFLGDLFILYFSALLIYTLNTGVVATVTVFYRVCLTLGLYCMFYVLGMRFFRTYLGIIRYSSFVDLQRVAAAMALGFVLSLIIRNLFNLNELLVPVRARDFLEWTALATVVMWGARVVVKYLYDAVYRRPGAEKVFIYGVKRGGIALAKSMRNQDPARSVVAGFVSDEADGLERAVLMGVSVYAADANLAREMKRLGATSLYVSPARSEHLRDHVEMVNTLIEEGIRIMVIPQEQQWDGKSNLSHTTLREVEIEDLLPRQKIEVDLQAIAKQLNGHRILVTGAAGSIGSEMAKQIALFAPAELVLVDQAETPLHDMRLFMARQHPEIKTRTLVADISHRGRMTAIFREYKPEYVFHAAAYKHVPMMEDNPRESITNNVEGTRIVADLSVQNGVRKFVMVSTDKAVNPTNVMGCSKRLCEIYVQSLDTAIKSGKIHGATTQFVTTRFGNVLGSNGSVIPLFREQIRAGGPVTVTHPDIIRYFMLIPEACQLVLEAGTMGHGGEIYVFDMGEPVKIVDLAHRMIQLSGADIEIKFTGLRDGEKLYEEVLNNEETVLPTFHPKIKIARVRHYEYTQVCRDFDALFEACHGGADDIRIVTAMKRLVPEFKSQHSPYEALDTVPDAPAVEGTLAIEGVD